MHINKFHVQPHAVPGPRGSKLKQAGGNGQTPASGNATQRNLGSDIDPTKPLREPLRSISEVRPDVVAAAKERLANGEYTTHKAAVETAESILNRS